MDKLPEPKLVSSAFNNLVSPIEWERPKRQILFTFQSVFNGFESVRKVIASLDSLESGITARPDDCFGAILQNFKCDPSLNLAVDAAAGSSR